MVLLTLTPGAKAAVAEYCRLKRESDETGNNGSEDGSEDLENLELGNPVDHNRLIDVSTFLVQRSRKHGDNVVAKEWRLDAMLKGAFVYQSPPPAKPEPSSEYKALMRRLRAEEEQRQYEHMLSPPARAETFRQRFPHTAQSFNIGASVGPIGVADDAEDEVTYADINRQMALIINVLVSIIACSVAIWIAARRWEVPQRLGLSMSGSGLVAAAEVAIYMGYIRRIKEAKGKEVKQIERKEVVETWVLDGSDNTQKSAAADENIRYRKGKHR